MKFGGEDFSNKVSRVTAVPPDGARFFSSITTGSGFAGEGAYPDPNSISEKEKKSNKHRVRIS